MTTKSEFELKTMLMKFKEDKKDAKKNKEQFEKHYCNGAIDVLEWILNDKEIE